MRLVPAHDPTAAAAAAGARLLLSSPTYPDRRCMVAHPRRHRGTEASLTEVTCTCSWHALVPANTCGSMCGNTPKRRQANMSARLHARMHACQCVGGASVPVCACTELACVRAGLCIPRRHRGTARALMGHPCTPASVRQTIQQVGACTALMATHAHAGTWTVQREPAVGSNIRGRCQAESVPVSMAPVQG